MTVSLKMKIGFKLTYVFDLVSVVRPVQPLPTSCPCSLDPGHTESLNHGRTGALAEN